MLGALACSKELAPAPTAAAAKQDEESASGTESEQAVSGSEGDPDDVEVSPNAAAPRGSAGLLAEATRVLETMTASSYSHKTHVAGTVYDLDCSGFVDYLLARVDLAALAELRAASVKRPLAKHFVQFLSAGPARSSWQRVTRIEDLTPGDIVTWDKPEDVVSTNTGHVMIVSASPEHRKESLWAVPIIDSSAAPHGNGDARKRSQATGVGRGVVLLEADASGAPIAYHWSELRSSRRHATRIALGRVL